jgi:hypothetical protein
MAVVTLGMGGKSASMFMKNSHPGGLTKMTVLEQ